MNKKGYQSGCLFDELTNVLACVMIEVRFKPPTAKKVSRCSAASLGFART